MAASSDGYTDVVRLLLEHGTARNIPYGGVSVFYFQRMMEIGGRVFLSRCLYSALFQVGHADITELVLESRADVNLQAHVSPRAVTIKMRFTLV